MIEELPQVTRQDQTLSQGLAKQALERKQVLWCKKLEEKARRREEQV
jgi:hypothetical protein